MITEETIFALASAAGRAGIAVIRLSGDQTKAALSYLNCSAPPPRKAVRALLTSLQPSSTFSVYLFGSMFLSYSHLLHCIIVTLCACTCIPIVLDTDAAAQGFGSPVYAATPDNISAVSARVDAARSMGGTELLAAVDLVMRLEVRRSLSSFTSLLEHFGPSPPSMRYCNTFHMYPAASATTS
jgi:hypothetical protein